MDKWREPVRIHSHQKKWYDAIWSGSMWRADCLDGHRSAGECSGTACSNQHRAFVDGNLNLKITLSVDWFGPFRGKYSGWHSTGAILMRIDNLPAHMTTLDRQCNGIHLVGLLPGPREQSKVRIQKFLRLITDELKVLDGEGAIITTAQHPEGKYCRSANAGWPHTDYR